MLSFGFEFNDLYSRDGLVKIDHAFAEFIADYQSDLMVKLQQARLQQNLSAKEYSDLITELAIPLELFLAELFQITSELSALSEQHQRLLTLSRCKRLFVQRRALKEYKSETLTDYHPSKIWQELDFAELVMAWIEQPEQYNTEINDALKYAAWASLTAEGRLAHPRSILFKHPAKLDYDNLVELNKQHHVYRDGFSLTQNLPELPAVLDQANYCIHCHNQGKDSCSKGLFDKQGIKENVFGAELKGCPLKEKISEMNLLKSQGYVIAPLAVAVIDNPMLAATGHRICNDCMKSCIYQKQEPVNIPQIESGVLNDVLKMAWGFEIYSLLTRWNPLNLYHHIKKPDTGHKILVAGLGPAGFTLAHYLLNEGHIVVAVDGLKIEPLPVELSGIDLDGQRQKFKPIKYINDYFEDLDRRKPYGFGGVAEYGITVRWNKNYLKVIRLLLERQSNFRMYGGVRFGSGLDYNNAKKFGFDHVALALGSGSPNQVNMPNSMARGVRMASDFLMALQLTGAARMDSIANLQISLPIIVIGGGLTAIDTATEAAAYYVRQVERFLKRHELLNSNHKINDLEQEFILHAKLFAEERVKAKMENRQPDFMSIIKELGGVNVVYRGALQHAPSYRLNHEELQYALDEGIGFIEHATPTAIIVDEKNNATGLQINHDKILPARSIFIAAGTKPNTVIQREDPAHFRLDGKNFKKIEVSSPLIALDQDHFGVSIFGDLDPDYAGNVVKAMASSKDGYHKITQLVTKRASDNVQSQQFFAMLNNQLIARVVEVKELAPSIIEVVLHAPLAAQSFQPGQFFRLQNLSYSANRAQYKDLEISLEMEGLAVTGASVDQEKGLVSVIVLEMGGSSNLCRYLKQNEVVVLMGPTGAPTKIEGKNIMLVGGGLGNAVLFSIAKAFKAVGSRVLYFAGYKKSIDRFKIDEIETYADQVVWCCDEKLIDTHRAQDLAYHGNIIAAIKYFAEGFDGKALLGLNQIDRIIAIGSSSMMEALQLARQNILKSHLSRDHHAVASINSPMQCMMKEICAQCLQRHVDPITGIETYVYSCFDQDQDMDLVDFDFLNNRLKQNSESEKQTAGLLKASITSSV